MARNKFKTGKEKNSGFFTAMEKAFSIPAFEDGLPVKYLPYIVFVTALMIFYIGNNHYAEKTSRKIDKIEEKVEDLRADYTTLKADYMISGKQSEVAKKVEKLGLEESSKPPYKIVIEEDEY